jgi:hypothetical protein
LTTTDIEPIIEDWEVGLGLSLHGAKMDGVVKTEYSHEGGVHLGTVKGFGIISLGTTEVVLNHGIIIYVPFMDHIGKMILSDCTVTELLILTGASVLPRVEMLRPCVYSSSSDQIGE